MSLSSADAFKHGNTITEKHNKGNHSYPILIIS